ncbi:PREDICTED: interleukin-31 receptor subunit alpha [Elephantulus edwardii]|uniref:interleukin-31 receptor subunit alpha n=1 Tax=Elephantulus edwardii TaxID=28737 RepID=UPI0003F0C40F|nr:PREDICTED: interleukin-31 receptor subunit alpha [Elephantulus edwardii]
MWSVALWLFPLLCRFSLAAPPHKPENISCIYYYRHNFTCTWSPKKEANDTWYTVKRNYHQNKSDICTSKNRASCSFFHPRVTYPDVYIIEVEAQNKDGISKSDTTVWTLDNIVKIEPLKIYDVNPILGVKQMVQIKWRRPVLAPVSATLNYTLRFRTVNSTKWLEVNFTSKDNDFDQTFDLTGLQPFTEYVLALRCAANTSNFWSDWSQEKTGTTEEQAPNRLDLWGILGPAKANGTRPVHLLWKEAKGAPVWGKPVGYNIWYFPENNTNLTETRNTTHQQLTLHLGNKVYWVSVISYNSMGKSPKSTLRIPASHETSFQCIEAMQAWLTQDQLVVEWQSSAPKVNTWIVEWVPDLDSEPTTFSWELVSHDRIWTAKQDKLKPFLCYNISVYPMLDKQVGEPYSIQAYIKEGVPLKGPMTKAENIDVKTVTITWEETPKSERRGFINNYTIFYRAKNGDEVSKTVNASILQYDLEALTRNTPYTVYVMANTNAGGAKGNEINFKTLSISIIEVFLISCLVGGGLLIFIILMVIYGLKKPNKLKHHCWPVIPNPAESSIAMWRGDGSKNKLALKEAQLDSVTNTDVDKILKLQYELSDELMVNSERLLVDVCIEESLKHQKNIEGEKNEYVTSPYMLSSSPRKSLLEVPTSAEIPPRKAESLSEGTPPATCSDTKEQLLASGQSLTPAHLCEETAPNPYLKNSVTTREFLTSGKLADQTERED